MDCVWETTGVGVALGEAAVSREPAINTVKQVTSITLAALTPNCAVLRGDNIAFLPKSRL